MSYTCEKCGAEYEWEMFFHNHLRSKHGVKCSSTSRPRLDSKYRDFLDSYYNIKPRPNLDHIKELAVFLDVKKETVYWWFFNRQQFEKRKHKIPKMMGEFPGAKNRMGNSKAESLLRLVTEDSDISLHGDTDENTTHDGIPSGSIERRTSEKAGARKRSNEHENDPGTSTATGNGSDSSK